MAIVVFGVGQLVLPPLAAHIVRDRLARDGRVLSVSVSAFPAIELVFGQADTVKVRMATYRASESEIASRIGQAADVSNLSVTINRVTSGLLTVDSVRVTKHGGRLTGTGVITEAVLRSAVPFLSSVTPVGSSHGELTLRGTANVPFLGAVSADATVGASDGKVVVSGVGLFSAFRLTVFANPKIDVESLSGGTAPHGIALSATWRLRSF